MKVVDFLNSKRVNKIPDKIHAIISNGSFVEHGFVIKKIELKQYIEKNDEKLGPYSLITLQVETDKGIIEMIYDEGYRGHDALDRAVAFLTANLGISGLILRAIITLKEELKKESKNWILYSN